MNEDVICPSCGAVDPSLIGAIPDSNVFAGRRLDHVLPGGMLWECRSCRLVFRYPRLPGSTVSGLYRDGIAEHWEYDLQARADWKLAATWIKENPKKDAKVLDVGCSTGMFLSQVLEGSYKKYGIEINKGAADRARQAGVSIVSEDIEDLDLARDSGLFDVITAFDVVEHVSDPLGFLGLLASAVKPGGRIIVGTGNSDAWNWKLMGARYWYCTNPEHISFINPGWCQDAASRTGLKLTRIVRYSHGLGKPSTGLIELVANLVYRFFPRLIARARLLGLGVHDAKKYPSLADHPPTWISAKDHILAEFLVGS
jgi:SAM-dependent methyltransferase